MERLYRGGEISPLLHPIDAMQWRQLGWTDKPETDDGIQQKTQETQTKTSGTVAALSVINGAQTASDMQPIPSIGLRAGEVILANKPEDGYESLEQVWELNPEILAGRYRTDVNAIAQWEGP